MSDFLLWILGIGQSFLAGYVVMKVNAEKIVKKIAVWLTKKMGEKKSNETTNKLSVFFLELAVIILKTIPDEGRIKEITENLEKEQDELETELDIKKFEEEHRGDK